MSTVRFESIPLFARLSPDEIDRVRPIFSERSFPPRTHVIVEGETGSEMFILVSGKVRIVKSMILPGIDIAALAGKDPSKVLATLTGEVQPLFGEMGLISDSPRSATVETLEAARFLVTDRERFFALVQADTGLGCKLLSALCERLADMVRSSNSEVMKLTTALTLLLSGKR
ncbi:MAG: cyclic nucleotide-binding domain-containing protein [Desulfovibrio sp.]|nr:cyclic nucleotide-binding domain-containing protein [Desulfovibrio sp.]MBI4960718.1 cyclic nucleotide-binding domain-containing protein [Desulfovibrio sp.]